jgi:PAS domain-containing protein
MRVVCSYCHKHLRDLPGAPAGVSHGMCPDCAAHFERLWAGMPLGEYLDDLPHPVMVVDGNARVIAVNGRMAAMLGRAPAELRGLRGGEALACSRSRLPGGCGNTIQCRECAIRGAVERVARTGRPVRRVPAYLRTAAGVIDLVVSARPRGGAVEVTVEELGPPRPVDDG